jgi:hypothetical protein
VIGLFAGQRAWLSARISATISSGELRGRAGFDPSCLALPIVSALEGSLLLSRAGSRTEPTNMNAPLLTALLGS